MSSTIDPFFLFEHPSNLASLATLIDSEKFEVVEVKNAVGPCNNTIAIIDLLTEDEDMDGLPIIVKTGMRREVMYDRENLSNALKRILPKRNDTEQLYITLPDGEEPFDYNVYNALLEAGIDVGRNAIKVTRIHSTNVINIETTNKSIRFYGEIMIAYNVT